jgi:transcriptional regulator NrdR family protein
MVDKITKEPRYFPFSRDNLFISLYRSCEHRPTALSDASSLSDTIISQLLPKVENSCIPLPLIQQQSYLTLKRFDQVAATYYKAYYWNPIAD